MRTSIRAFLALVALFPAVALAVPGQVAHQGQLSDATGPVTAQLEMTFQLYDAETSGTAAWTETRTVDVVAGHYSVLLGPDDDSGTSLTDVLVQEPALFLEVTVGTGAPLLPRQPIVSVPYAVSAGTAESVSGGSVDAAEIQVGGVTIIDGSGTWTGPAITSGTPAWANLAGIPSDLADGDSDALGGLSCQDGEPAAWNSGSSQWECGDPAVALDHLDTTGATQDQVLTFDGAQASWSSPTGVAGTQVAISTFEGTFNSTVDFWATFEGTGLNTSQVYSVVPMVQHKTNPDRFENALSCVNTSYGLFVDVRNDVFAIRWDQIPCPEEYIGKGLKFTVFHSSDVPAVTGVDLGASVTP